MVNISIERSGIVVTETNGSVAKSIITLEKGIPKSLVATDGFDGRASNHADFVGFFIEAIRGLGAAAVNVKLYKTVAIDDITTAEKQTQFGPTLRRRTIDSLLPEPRVFIHGETGKYITFEADEYCTLDMYLLFSSEP